MASNSNLSSFLFLLMIFAAAAAFSAEAAADDKFLHIHCYSHDNEPVLSVNLHRNDSFGNILVFDNVLREGIDPGSPALARPQGMGVFSDLTGAYIFTTYTVTFTAGEFNGSSFNVFGLTSTTGVSDRSIVGGTGRFRGARGYVLTEYLSARIEDFNIYIMFA